MGTVIFLNGASSSGKTSIARELQQRWDGPLLLFGIDDVISMMPFKFAGDGEQAEKGFLVKDSSDPATFNPGPLGYRLNDLAAAFVANLAKSEFDIVIDYVLDKTLLEAFTRHLSSVEVVFCGVFCQPEELETRERSRGDRAAGLATRQADSVHFCRALYDLELDSTSQSAANLAEEVKVFLETNGPSSGLGKECLTWR